MIHSVSIKWNIMLHLKCITGNLTFFLSFGINLSYTFLISGLARFQNCKKLLLPNCAHLSDELVVLNEGSNTVGLLSFFAIFSRKFLISQYFLEKYNYPL